MSICVVLPRIGPGSSQSAEEWSRAESGLKTNVSTAIQTNVCMRQLGSSWFPVNVRYKMENVLEGKSQRRGADLRFASAQATPA